MRCRAAKDGPGSGVGSCGASRVARTFPPSTDRGAAVSHRYTAGDAMNTAAVVTFVVIGGLVWGGFALIIATAFRKERDKQLDRG
jgi:uncharacterized protein (DUF983 family)